MRRVRVPAVQTNGEKGKHPPLTLTQPELFCYRDMLLFNFSGKDCAIAEGRFIRVNAANTQPYVELRAAVQVKRISTANTYLVTAK